MAANAAVLLLAEIMAEDCQETRSAMDVIRKNCYCCCIHAIFILHTNSNRMSLCFKTLTHQGHWPNVGALAKLLNTHQNS